MKRKDITDRIAKVTKELDKSESPNFSNQCQNELTVLNYMLERFDECDFSNNRGRYDEETDFQSAYDNAVDELIELEEENVKKTTT